MTDEQDGNVSGGAANACKPPQQDGILVLDKPSGPSSASCIARIKRQLGQKKIGHAGTLDPMASGVLLVLLGQATKLSGHLMDGGEKVYSGRLKLGETTDTWDAEGRIVSTASLASFEAMGEEEAEAFLAAAIGEWAGESEQTVPPYSAAKHQGRPLYELARKGLETPVKTKTVKISRVESEWVGLPYLRFRVACSSGTYIRSLAHSLGVRLGCGATLVELTREYSHPFGLAQSFTLEAVLAEPEKLAERVIPLAEALPGRAKVFLDAAESGRVKNGHAVACKPSGCGVPGQKALLLDESGAALALAESAFPSGGAGKELAWVIERGLWNQ